MSKKNIGAAIEHGNTGIWYGRLIELPGTHGRAQSKKNLMTVLSEELEYHLEWLGRHSEMIPPIRNSTIMIKEEIEDISELGESGGEVAFFDFDRQPVGEEKLNDFIRYMGHNREDLMKIVVDLDRGKMNKIPKGKGRNVTDILSHVCNAEEFYLSRLGERADELYEGHLGMSVAEADHLPIFERLEVVRSACLKTLRELAPIKGEGTFTRIEYTAYPSERWSFYKVLRRFLEHEREHIYNIREYLGFVPRSSESH